MRHRLAIALALFLPIAAGAAERKPQARLCAEDLPEGAHLSALPTCAAVAARKPRGDGFRDLGNGVSVRIGGRAGYEYGVSR